MSEQVLVGVMGLARSGKDTFAQIAADEFGFTQFAFADKIRECLYALNPIVGNGSDLKSVIDSFGWTQYKETQYGPEIRRLLQRLGTEVVRDLLDEDMWLKQLDKCDENKVVVSDMRFKNEADFLKSRDSILVRVVRPGQELVNMHVSETSLTDYPTDFTIVNDSDLETYRQNIRKILRNVVK